MGRHRLSEPIVDPVPGNSAGTAEIGFSVPARYNTSHILFDNLANGRGDRVAVTGPGGQRSYADLCADAARFGNALVSLGPQRDDRVLMFLDYTPVYPTALVGAVGPGSCRF